MSTRCPPFQAASLDSFEPCKICSVSKRRECARGRGGARARARAMSERSKEQPPRNPHARLAQVLATGISRAKNEAPDDTWLSSIVTARSSRWLEREQKRGAVACVRQEDRGDFLLSCAPKQVPKTSNTSFYDASYNANIKSPNSTLTDIARTIDSGMVVGSYGGAILRTLPANYPVTLVQWWDKFTTMLPQFKTGSGPFNTVSVSKNRMPSRVWKMVRPDGVAPWDYGVGKIAIRQASLDPIKPSPALLPMNVVKEMYLTGYASHYKLGPTLLATFYRKIELNAAERHDLSNISLQDLVDSEMKITIDELRRLIVETSTTLVGTNASRPLHYYVSYSCAWDGDCSRLLRDLADDDPAWVGPPKYNSTQKTALYKQFAEVFVELLVNAAAVGFFHGDIKPENMLYQVNIDEKTGVDASTLKVCLTDFDANFCRVMPPQERPESVHCLLVANVCLFLGMIRCYRSNAQWIATRNAIRPVMQRVMLGIDIGKIAENGDETLCLFLQNSDAISPKSATRVSYDESYNGQKPGISAGWQHHVNHYMKATVALKVSAAGNQNVPCIPIDPQKSVYSQVVAYALQEPEEESANDAMMVEQARDREALPPAKRVPVTKTFS